ncbi:internal virion protein [Citrobacter phage Citrof5]
MCWMVAIPIAMAAVSSISGQQQQAKAIASSNDASRRQAIQMVKESNIQNANSRLEQKQLLEDASQELTAQNMQKVQTMGTIRAAIGEGMLEGNSMDRIARIEEGKFIREANVVNDQYRRDYASLFAKQLGNTQSTADQIRMMQKAEGKQKSKLASILDPLSLVAGSTANAYIDGKFDSKTASGSGPAPISAAKGTKVPTK